MLPGKRYTVREIVRLLRRRRWLVLLPVALGTVTGVLAYQFLPRYRSETLISVVAHGVPDKEPTSGLVANIGERLQSTAEQVLTRSALARIIEDFDLYKQQRASGSLDAAVERMRRDIDVTPLSREPAIRIGYTNADPKNAQSVTARLAALYVKSRTPNRAAVNDTTGSSRIELQEAKRRLIEHEGKLEDYRRRFAGQLPSQLQSNLQALQVAQTQLQSLGESMNQARDKRAALQRQIATAQTIPADVSPGAAGSSAGGSTGTSIVQQLESARAKLDAAKMRDPSDYAEVLALEQSVRDLQTKLDHDTRRADAHVAALTAELETLEHRITADQVKEGRLKKRLAAYQARIDAVPARTSELADLMRQYTTLQEAYARLLLKEDQVNHRATPSKEPAADSFSIVDPPSFPRQPYNQAFRLAVLFGAPLTGLACAFMLLGFIEYRDLTFKCEEDAERVLAIPVLALIPIIEGKDDTARRRKWLSIIRRSAVLLIAASVSRIV